MMRNLKSYIFNFIESQNKGYIERLKTDNNYFKEEMIQNMSKVIGAMHKSYRYIPKIYVKRYLTHIKKKHLNNPQAMLYIESELGAPLRQLELIKNLEKCDYEIRDKNVLDIGCSNGALLLACMKWGANRLVGIEIDKNRLRSAKELIGKRNVDLLQLDIVCQALPERYGTFDVIFCTDVIDHVSDIEKFFSRIQRYLSEDKESFAFVSIFNKYYFGNVISEPHYNVPGLILLRHDQAANLWHKIRDQFNSTADYEVSDWYTYWEYKKIANSCHLDIEPFVKIDINLLDQNHEEQIAIFYKNICSKLETIQIEKEDKSILLGAVEDYCSEFLEDHSLPVSDCDRKVYLFMKYYAQPLNMIIKHRV
jgi:2-polyprenyl-3-methyl-5-hydroxy-6-metoxy-1,4-benzoquinol methylase